MDTQLVRALANSTRIQIFDAMSEGPLTPRQLGERIGIRQSVVGYHVTVLRKTGCIQQVEADQSGPASERRWELTPRARPTRMIGIHRNRPRHGHPPAALVRSVLERGRTNRGEDLFGRRQNQLSCTSMVVDRQGWQEISTAISEALNHISTAQAESAQRLRESGEEGINATIAVASFESPAGRPAA